MLGLKKKDKMSTLKTFFKEEWKEEELIGEGSYGKVYKAKKEEFGIATYSAIKQIEIPQGKAEVQALKTEGMTQDGITRYYEKSVQKWVEEIKFMSIFKDSENIVDIEDYEIIKKKNEIGWIINIRMELLKNLDAYILENNLTDKEIVKMAIDVATALEDCEENNVVHRDIKPDNIFVNKKGIYKVGDFGIAKHIEKTVSNMSKKGTENYMAPELYKNEKGNRTVDTYSLGIMLYRYFNYNRLPFLPNYPEEITMEAREEALYKRISGEKMPVPQNAPREISEIILKACSYYPKDRYASATELKKDLQNIYAQIKKPKMLFNFNEKQMNKLFIENTKSDSHSGTLSVFEDEQPKDVFDMTVGIGFYEQNQEMQTIQSNSERQGKIENAQSNNNQQVEKAISEQNIEQQVKLDIEDKTTDEKENLESEPVSEEEKEDSKISKKERKAQKKKERKEKNKNELPIQEKDNTENLKEVKEKAKKEEKIKSPLFIKLKKYRKLMIILFIIILIILGIIFIPKLTKQEETPVIEYVKMIQVVGLTSEEATQKITELGLEVQYEYEETDDETQVGKVIEQSVQENQDLVKGSSVTLKVAVSKQKVKMINVVGMNIQEATQKLTEIGLQVKATEQYSEDVEQGIIISQMTPEGEQINLGTTIELLVSLGVEVQEQGTQNDSQDNSKTTINNNNQQNNSQSNNQSNDSKSQNNNQSNDSESQNNAWSGWVESLPSGVTSANYNIEQKIQYSYRKVTDYKTTPTSGYEANGTVDIYGNWSVYENTTKPSGTSENLQIIDEMYVKPGVFTYQHWAVFKNGIGSWSSGYWKNGASTEPQRHVITFSEDKGKQTMYECAKCNAQNKFATASSKYTFTRVDKPAGTTVYTYKKRDKSTVVRYVRWSDWSEYSDNVVSENSDTQVRKRTMYRYKSK